MTNLWVWKSRGISKQSKLLYEPGNWGDALKIAWLTNILQWQIEKFGVDEVYYVDPFAGAPAYDLTMRSRLRIKYTKIPVFELIAEKYLEHDKWPSAASVASSLLYDPKLQVTVFDKDSERLKQWQELNQCNIWEADSGWTVVEAANPEAKGLLLIDPYDFLAEWRKYLASIVSKAEETSILLYLHNRSLRGKEEFKEYRDFRNSLDNLRQGMPKVIARVASDSFLPKSHHELLFLPNHAIMQHKDFNSLLAQLESIAISLSNSVRELEAFDI